MNRLNLCLVGATVACAAGIAVACGGGGGSGTSSGSPGDGGTDATMPVVEAGSATEAAVQDGASAPTGDGGDAGDAGATGCAAPSVATNAALCVTISPEAIAFLSDPDFDGKGLLTVGVFSDAHPTVDAGLAAVLLPSPDAGTADGGAALVDLSMPVKPVRFELPAATVYVRAIFIDNPASLADGGTLQAGWWIGGLDLSMGIEDAPLVPVSLTAGQATNITIDLIALRKLTVTVSREPNLTPAGNGQGPLTITAVNTSAIGSSGTYLFGAAESPCADVSGDAGVTGVSVPGWVIGTGPYWLVATLDDFGAGGSFPAGGMFSLLVDGGVYAIPAQDEIAYAAGAYQVTGTAKLTYVNPYDGGADADSVSCP